MENLRDAKQYILLQFKKASDKSKLAICSYNKKAATKYYSNSSYKNSINWHYFIM